MFPETEILLYEASRAQLVREFILPALKDGAWVLCDRFFDSTTAYQGAGRQIPLGAVHWLNRFAVDHCIPELTFLFELPLHLRQARLSQRPAKAFDRIEYEPSEFFRAVTEGYRQLAEQEPQRFVIIDTEADPDSVAEVIWKHVYEHFFPR
jgi:dTMP kinase